MTNYLNEPYEIIDAPLWWHLKGLSETTSGYGSKLNSGKLIKLPDGRTRRMYTTIYSNIGTSWIILDSVKRVIR